MSLTHTISRYSRLASFTLTGTLALLLSGCFDGSDEDAAQNQPLVPAPAVPEEVVAVSGDTQAFITWPRIETAESYSLYIASEEGVTPQSYASLADGVHADNIVSPHIIRDLDNSKTYYAVLTSKNAGGESTASNVITFTPESGVPAPDAPKLKSASPGSNRVKLSWDKIDGALSYRVYITYPENAQGDLAGTTKHVTAKTNGYVVSDLENNKTYTFAVSAENEAGESVLSSPRKATPKRAKVRPQTPRNLAVTDNKDGSITVDWDVSDSIGQYNLFVSTDASISSRNYKNMPAGKIIRDAMPPHVIRDLAPKTYYVVINGESGNLSSRDTKAVGISVSPKPVQKAAPAPVAKADDTLEPIDGNRAYEKLGIDGSVLPNQRKKYKYQPWACVRHKKSGQVWEVKSNDGSFRDARFGYPWTKSAGAKCVEGVCSIEDYVAKANKMRLCGYDDWSIPSRKELKRLRDKKQQYPNPKINVRFFPNTGNNYYWSGTPHKHDKNSAWFVFFSDGSSYFDIKTNPMKVRLTRNK